MTPIEMFDILEKAQVSVADFSRLTSCSRVTLYRWRNGGMSVIRDQLRLRIATDVATRLQKLTLDKRLPLKEPYAWTERLAVLKKLLA